MNYFRPIACLLCVINTCALVDWIIVKETALNDNPVLLMLLGLIQIPIVWWFKSRDRAKETNRLENGSGGQGDA